MEASMMAFRPRAFPAVALAFLLLAGAAATFADDPTRAAPGVDQTKIDAACKKAGDWLLDKVKKGLPPLADKSGLHTGQTYKELALYALLYAGNVGHDDPELAKLALDIGDDDLYHTYGTAIRAQALQKFDAVKFQSFIRNCGQFLIDNQGQDGYWGYSAKVELAKPTIPSLDPAKVASGAKAGAIVAVGAGRATTTKTIITRRGWGKSNDNSNTQYALLGLAACMAAGLWPPNDAFDLAEKWFTAEQDNDGGWNYKEHGSNSYGSMTAGGVSSLSIILRAKGNQEPWKDIRIQKALKWLGDNLSFGGNPKGNNRWHFYWIYGVERAGSLAGVEWFGDRPWFKEGCDWLLSNQKGDGSFGDDKDAGDKVSDTCWAILFLRRATRGIVYSGPGGGHK
jgi:hypothetical protein